MNTVTLKDGFTVELDENALDNSELLDAIAEVDEGNILLLGRTVRLLLGKENAKKLYDHLRTADGRVPVEPLSQAFAELVNSFQTGKNSSSSPD